MSENHHDRPSPRDETGDTQSIEEGAAPRSPNQSGQRWLRLPDPDDINGILSSLNEMKLWNTHLAEKWHQERAAPSPWFPYTGPGLGSGSDTGRATSSRGGGTGSSHETDGGHPDRDSVPVLGYCDPKPLTSRDRPYRARIRSGGSQVASLYNITENGRLSFLFELYADSDDIEGSTVPSSQGSRGGYAEIGRPRVDAPLTSRSGMSEAQVNRLRVIADMDVQGASDQRWDEISGWM